MLGRRHARACLAYRGRSVRDFLPSQQRGSSTFPPDFHRPESSSSFNFSSFPPSLLVTVNHFCARLSFSISLQRFILTRLFSLHTTRSATLYTSQCLLRLLQTTSARYGHDLNACRTCSTNRTAGWTHRRHRRHPGTWYGVTCAMRRAISTQRTDRRVQASEQWIS